MSYAELLKDPRWQRKRLEIMERDEWTCQMCGSTEDTLTVHHKSYRRENGVFADIWDYEGEDLITLCEGCHAEEEGDLKEIQKECFFILRDTFNSAEEICFLLKLLVEWKRNIGRIVVPDLIYLFGDIYTDMKKRILNDRKSK